MYLLDTNICIYIINNNPRVVVEKIKQLKPSQVKLSAISVGELEYGVCKSRNRERNKIALVDFVSGFDILPFDDADAEVFGIVRAELEKRGQVIGSYDMQIAAQAIARDLILVTNNTREFERIKDLKFENWI
ncbi:type II toxin-antitoxin system tRNA(fMet)-specific endonuclease VapC [Gracilinema caldarium]|uniref:Ribonuclease VapC n=1 Tax=Gracilinema caldarium (strain ATCC 51460 / DSM 7334 / H1) TaxID=744872 RepID=F8EZT3_GRAC1|nr:type II toxin-antitoxin system VapC family toxin [Gracilinema caldarium]AEJ18446.1 PilT protein domain protein [Gracilinema caldarium DSM 7334]